jgi:hypothetical protein
VTNTKIPILSTAILLFALGFGGRILLHDYPNFETVMVSVFLASMLLPLNIALLVTMSIMVLSDIYLGYMGATKILFFTYTGFLLVSLISSKFKNKLEGKFTSGTVYKFTSSGIIFALVYDMWTNFGVFWLSYGHTIDNLFLVYALGLPFMIYHLLSSIVTFSLIGFPVYCILTKKSNSDYISEQDLKFEI